MILRGRLLTPASRRNGSCCHSSCLRRNELEQVAGASQDARQPFAPRQTEVRTKQHVAGVEKPHRLIVHDGKAILLEIAAPPVRMEQPGFGNDIAALAMTPRKAAPANVARG